MFMGTFLGESEAALLDHLSRREVQSPVAGLATGSSVEL